jgi:hypothetical protein
MKAIKMIKEGGPEAFEYTEVEKPAPFDAPTWRAQWVERGA